MLKNVRKCTLFVQKRTIKCYLMFKVQKLVSCQLTNDPYAAIIASGSEAIC